MTTPGRPEPARRTDEFLRKRAAARREKIRGHFQRDRDSAYRVPTWVLAVVLAVIVAGFAIALIVV